MLAIHPVGIDLEILVRYLTDNVVQYSGACGRLCVVRPADLYSFTVRVEATRLRASLSLLDSYMATKLCPFVPVRLDGIESVLYPPVVENHDDRLCLMDGVHRSFAAVVCEVDRIVVMSVRNGLHSVLPPPPGTPVRISKVEVWGGGRSGISSKNLVRDLDPDLFRKTGKLLKHPVSLAAIEAHAK